MPFFTSYDGCRLWYELVGAGPPLICLAGGPGADVRDLGDLGGLTADRTLVLFDARAGGRSEVPADRASCAFWQQARDVEELRLHLDLTGIDLLAHSAGALTAQEYAARFGTVGRMVLVTPAGRVAREPDDAETTAIRAIDVKTRAPDVDWGMPPSWLRAAFYADDPDRPARLVRLATVTAPVLAVAGGSDGIAGTATARLIGECYPNAEVQVLGGCGHYPWLDDPVAFRRRVVAFLNQS